MVMEEWNVYSENIRAIMTDHGSNIVEAFRQHWINDGYEEEKDSVDLEDVEPEDKENEEFLDEEDFDSRKIDRGVTLRIGCFAHTLQLVENKFTTDVALQRLMKLFISKESQ